jgi:uncharacterized membrane protein
MAIFTMITGNAFGAFPVMTAGIGLPLNVHQFNGNPAILGVIKAQWPTALLLLIVNTILLYVFVFRF